MTGLRVRATRRGFFGQQREPGDEFEIDSKAQLGTWMDPVGGKAVAEKSAPPPADPFLDRTVDQIKDDLPALAVEQLAAYREQEAAGKDRKGVIEAIDAAVAEKSANA
ncbi:MULTISPECIES: hypothetical protein [Stenotrophomonas]|uniref:hypothetical protein n=1 Tax=Stenotrophomonas maltophilia TaxID=40324 RepID=UPI000C15B6FC|nr:MULTISPECIES: hypothetical protein [Stenotrophomonas]MBH1476988.1 hypothetical protein [Stenotrophomonas maltophilia]MBH1503269.1 hypothetical protein [Stenotrophomonas maltophilia]HDS1537452.1 hypothetical protein [Stenotrophomonas maltophilia]